MSVIARTSIEPSVPGAAEPAGPIGSYAQAVDYLFHRTDYERMSRVRHHAGSYDLGRMVRLCQAIGQPQSRFASAHVAGTKGKGSVSTMLAHLLAGGGCTTGLYTSPHLIDVRERVMTLSRGQGGGPVLRAQIGEQDFVAAMNQIVGRLDGSCAQPEGRPTFFEMITALAFVHFARRQVDLAVLEVGLGGRLDATNVVTPLVCGITSIGRDHTRQLGETVEQIAGEKAGIIKPGVPVVVAPQRPTVERVILDRAAELGARPVVVGRDVRVRRRLVNHRWPRRWEVMVTTPSRQFPPLLSPLLGRHQADNLAVAAAMLDELLLAGQPIELDAAVAALEQTQWPGRLDVRQRRDGRNPWLVLDGAHTVESLQSVLATLAETFNYNRLIVVAGVLADKDVPGLMGQLANGADIVVLTRSDHPHAADPERLATYLATYGPLVRRHIEPDAREAVQLALSLSAPDDLVLVTGSIYLVGLVARSWG